jgi:hypothetical protein
MTFLMNQVNIVCTSATRPASPVQGMMIYEIDTDFFWYFDGTTWVQRFAIPVVYNGTPTALNGNALAVTNTAPAPFLSGASVAANNTLVTINYHVLVNQVTATDQTEVTLRLNGVDSRSSRSAGASTWTADGTIDFVVAAGAPFPNVQVLMGPVAGTGNRSTQATDNFNSLQITTQSS